MNYCERVGNILRCISNVALLDAPEVEVSIRGGHGQLAVNEGDDVYLECTFSANPEPHTVSWLVPIGIINTYSKSSRTNLIAIILSDVPRKPDTLCC